jgi:hypothetical protein
MIWGFAGSRGCDDGILASRTFMESIGKRPTFAIGSCRACENAFYMKPVMFLKSFQHCSISPHMQRFRANMLDQTEGFIFVNTFESIINLFLLIVSASVTYFRKGILFQE